MLICWEISSVSNALNCAVTIVTEVVIKFQCFHMLLIQGCLYVLIDFLHFLNKVGQTIEFIRTQGLSSIGHHTVQKR